MRPRGGKEIGMAICKECGTKNPDEAKFCSECGGVLATIDATAVKAALDKVEKEFEKDAKVSLDRSRLTYICDICGKVNPIDTPDKRCSRCGKKMPRSEYVKALQRIKEAKNVQQNLIQDMPQDNLPKVMPKPPAKNDAAQQSQPVLYRMNQNAPKAQGGVQQNGQIIQPFVIVPYVSQNQPVLQYNPNTVYRYHQYSDSEKRRNQETLARLAREREEAERERMARMDNDERSKSDRKSRKYSVDSGYKKPNGRLTAFISLLCALVAIIVAFISELSDIVAFQAFIDAPDVFFETLSASSGGFLAFVGLIVFVVAMLGLAITAIIRFFKGTFNRRQLLFPFVALVGTVLALVGCVMDEALFSQGYIALPVVMIATSVISFVAEFTTRTNKQLY